MTVLVAAAVQVLACQAADVVTAVAAVGGVVELEPGNDDGLQACDAAFAKSGHGHAAVSLFKVHGTADPIVPWTGDALLGFPPVMQDVQRWAARIGRDASNSSQLWKRGTFTETRWAVCNSSSAASNCSSSSSSPAPSVHLVSNDGGVHEWPETPDFDTTRAIVDFFFAAQPQSPSPAQPKQREPHQPQRLHTASTDIARSSVTQR